MVLDTDMGTDCMPKLLLYSTWVGYVKKTVDDLANCLIDTRRRSVQPLVLYSFCEHGGIGELLGILPKVILL